MNNKVELLGYYGGDLTHAASAWTSTSRDITPEKRERIGSLLKMLADKQHFTPFEKSFLHFLVTCDIASHIHIIKHRIGVSANSESARYKELRDDKYYIPIDWPEQEQKEFENHIKKSYELYHQMINHLVYRKGFNRKRAKESARFFLPYANQITMDLSFNFRSFMHFQKLRNSPDAQLEIREMAQEMLRLVKETRKFDLSLKGFGYYD